MKRFRFVIALGLAVLLAAVAFVPVAAASELQDPQPPAGCGTAWIHGEFDGINYCCYGSWQSYPCEYDIRETPSQSEMAYYPIWNSVIGDAVYLHDSFTGSDVAWRYNQGYPSPFSVPDRGLDYTYSAKPRYLARNGGCQADYPVVGGWVPDWTPHPDEIHVCHSGVWLDQDQYFYGNVSGSMPTQNSAVPASGTDGYAGTNCGPAWRHGEFNGYNYCCYGQWTDYPCSP